MCLLGWRKRMLHLLLTLRSLRRMQKRNPVKRVGPPTESDWENAQVFVHFLKKFYETTLKLSVTKTSWVLYKGEEDGFEDELDGDDAHS
ncbi:unnamed protein product, partial [Prunus brigantina]